ncbi:MAG: T9SS type A sorting domain-containing protein [Saprospiraceae bacterium]|nr:T9SS type A sorting domain-containing protein [Saprospiraceae bacterium]
MIRRCPTTVDLINSGRMSVLLTLLSLVSLWGAAIGQPCQEDKGMLSWKDSQWQPGQKEGLLMVPLGDGGDSIAMRVQISTQAGGSFSSFGISTPYIDGRTHWHFGKGNDLGVIFDPDAGQGTSMVEATLFFAKPVSCLSFEISDIDASGPRKDSVYVFANAQSTLPALTTLSEKSTVAIKNFSAVATGHPSGPARSGSSLEGQDAGSVLVDFGDAIVESVTVRYMEASPIHDPGGRGIGLFGNLSLSAATLEPMQISSFSIEKSEDCQPIVSWSTIREFNLDAFTIGYSYDGFNFAEAAHATAKNSYTDTNRYELLIPRGMNNQNHFHLTLQTPDGSAYLLKEEKVSGEDCFNLASVNVYPNPSSKDHFFVEVGTSRPQHTDIAIIDQEGKKVFATKYLLKEGKNWLKVDSTYFPPGIYHLRFVSGDEIVTRKVSII